MPLRPDRGRRFYRLNTGLDILCYTKIIYYVCFVAGDCLDCAITATSLLDILLRTFWRSTFFRFAEIREQSHSDCKQHLNQKEDNPSF